ncbi:MAG: hypothetical protein RL032_676 [Pseudomonadota bacterium]|jgi:hypothetical protein
MEFFEYPKWVYPAGVREQYAPGQEPVLVQDANGEAALGGVAEVAETAPDAAPKRRGRPAKDAA